MDVCYCIHVCKWVIMCTVDVYHVLVSECVENSL